MYLKLWAYAYQKIINRRLIYSINGMMACNFCGLRTVLTREDFSTLSGRLLPEFPKWELAAFSLGGVAGPRSKSRYLRYERVFLSRLSDEFDKKDGFKPLYSFSDEEAQTYLEDYFDGHRRSYRDLDFQISTVQGSQQKVINIAVLQKQMNYLEFWLNVRVPSKENICFSVADIRKLEGTCRAFRLVVADRELRVFPNNVYYFDQSADEE